jgi:hypothetical protein
MAKEMGPRRKKPSKRAYKPERPVVSVRIPQIIFEDISAEAKAQNVNLTDVIYRRLLAYQRYEEIKDEASFWQMIETNTKARPDARGAAWRQIVRRELEIGLERLGYTRIDGPGGALWAEPDASIPASIVKALKDRKE